MRTRAHTGRLAPPCKHWRAAVVKPHGQQPRSFFSGSWVFTVPHEDTRRASRAELATSARNSLLTLGERRHASPRSVDKASARANQGEDRHRVFVSLYVLRSASSKKKTNRGPWIVNCSPEHKICRGPRFPVVGPHCFIISGVDSFLVSAAPSILISTSTSTHKPVLAPDWRGLTDVLRRGGT